MSAPEQAPASGSKKKLIILAVVGALVLVGGAVGGTMFLLGGKETKEAPAKHKAAGDGEEGGDAADAADGEGDGAAEGEDAAAGEEAAPEGEKSGGGAHGGGGGKEGEASAYVELAPPFVVNFQDEKKRARFLKAEISIMAKAPAVQEAIKQNLPAIRNSLVMLLSRQVYEELMTPEGKEKLRTEALAEVQAVVTKVAGKKKAKGVKDLFFSSLVMQ